MARLSDLERLLYVFTGASLGVATMGTYLQSKDVARDAIVRGQPREVDDTVGVVLRFRRDSTFYLIFNRRLADSVLDGARLHFRHGGEVSDVRVSADTGRVTWKVGSRRSHITTVGLRIFVHARLSAPASGAAGDSLDLVLPGLTAVAQAHGKTPMVARGSYTRAVRGDSDRIGEFAIYESTDDARRASKHWEQAAMVLVGLLVALGARVILRMAASA